MSILLIIWWTRGLGLGMGVLKKKRENNIHEMERAKES